MRRVTTQRTEMEFATRTIRLQRAVRHLDDAERVALDLDLENPSRKAVQFIRRDHLGMTGSKRDQAQFETFLKLLSSASVSSTTKDNVGYARFVWTLPE